MANSLSDKAVYLYDVFFSANITAGRLESMLRNSSLDRLAFEEVISYPNLLDQMKAHDRYDELIGIETYAYDLIFSNVTREENSQLESNAFLQITNENSTQSSFDDFIKTVAGHIGFGLVMNNPKTSYDIAANSIAVSHILNNKDAVRTLLASEFALKAFGQTPEASAAIFADEEIFKSLRTSLLFNQNEAFPENISDNTYIEYVGGKYFVKPAGEHNYMLVSDDMINWISISHPVYNFTFNPYWDTIAYDELNKAWFFISRTTGAPPFFTKDFVNFQNVDISMGNDGCLSITNFNDKIVASYKAANNAWRVGYIEYELGQDAYVLKDIPVIENNLGYYYFRKGPSDYLWMGDGNHYYRFLDRDWAISTNFWANDASASSRGIRGVSWANDRYFYTHYYSSGSDQRIGVGVINPSQSHFNGAQDRSHYWLKYGTTNYTRVVYANGVYIVNVPGGYAISLNGFVWDEKLFDITYSYNISTSDNRGFIGHIPNTFFTITSYDASSGLVLLGTTTTTTAAPSLEYLPEGLTELECLEDNTSVGVLSYNGDKMVFNSKDYYENTNYVVTGGVYKILNVPEEYPIAVLNYGKSDKITYTGSISKKHYSTLRGTDADYTYDFFYGDVTIKVTGNFETVSLYYYKSPSKQGYLGMEKILVHQDYLATEGTVASDAVKKVSDTTITAASIRNFDCVGSEAKEDGEVTKVSYTTTTTTETPSFPVLFETTTTTTSAPLNFGDENYTNAIDVSTATPINIGLDANNKLTINGVSFESEAAAGNRYCFGPGTYTLNVEADKPIAIEGATSSSVFGNQESIVSYSGDFYKRSLKSINGVPHYFYHGQVVMIVEGPFQTLSFYSFTSNYAGAENSISFSRNTTTTTTFAPITTTTTLANTTYSKCVGEDLLVTVSGDNYIFNGEDYNSNIKFALNTGQTLLRDIPQSHPIAILNYGKWSAISYSGNPMKSVTHTAPDGRQYAYYYGDVLVTVNSDFGIVSYDCSNDGYMGGEDKIIFSSSCSNNIQPAAPAPTTTTTTTVYLAGLLRPTTTTTTTAAPTTTTTTAAPTSAEFCLVPDNSVGFSAGNYLFNGDSGLYGMTTGTYVFKNVSASHPIAFLNFGKTSLVTYDGQYSAGSKTGLDGNQYSYFYGDVTVNVTGNFGFLSYECFYHGYMGGENNIIFDNTNCI